MFLKKRKGEAERRERGRERGEIDTGERLRGRGRKEREKEKEGARRTRRIFYSPQHHVLTIPPAAQTMGYRPIRRLTAHDS